MPSKTAVPPALGLDWGTERALLDSGPRASPGSSASDAMQRSLARGCSFCVASREVLTRIKAR